MHAAGLCRTHYEQQRLGWGLKRIDQAEGRQP